MSTERHLVIAAAGTGGHVMPGLAVAAVMRSRGWRVSWIGTTTGMEASLVEKHGIDFYALNFQGVRGRGLVGAVKGGVKLLSSGIEARRVLGELKPDAIFSTGGYVAVPVGYAAKTLGIPLVLMNCDADLLLSTQTLMPVCRFLACGFAGGARSWAKEKGRTTGNPVRADILAIDPPDERLAGREGRLRLFVFGGSLGAKILNDTVPEALAKIPEDVRPEVVHQTGRDRDEAVRARYEALGVKATVLPFIDDMATRYRESDLVLCRAGATSVSELCAAGAASVLVPFVAKTTAHQLGNARFMAERGAARMLKNEECTPEALAALLEGLTRDDILAMAKNARSLARPMAAEGVADLIEEALAA